MSILHFIYKRILDFNSFFPIDIFGLISFKAYLGENKREVLNLFRVRYELFVYLLKHLFCFVSVNILLLHRAGTFL